MKPTLRYATLLMMFALPQAFAVTELESLRARCARQEGQIRQLEGQIQELQSGKPAKSAMVSPAATADSHTVRAGESLERIARRAGCSPEGLAKANGLTLSAAIHPGQKLKLPGEMPTQGTPAPAAAKVAPPIISPAAGKSHTIRKGETYGSLARKYKVPIATLIAANPGVKATSLRPGQVIRLSPAATVSTPASAAKSSSPIAAEPMPRQHSAATTISATRKPASTPPQGVITPTPASPSPTASAPAVAEKPAQTAEAGPLPEISSSPRNTGKKIRSITIEGEMTYGEFAATHGTDSDRLNDLNGLDLTNATVLAKGSELYVPAQP